MTDKKRPEPSSPPRQRGISVRTLSSILCVVAILAVSFSLFESQRTMSHAQSLYELERARQKCDRAIQQFMDGSDYLTLQVQQFVIKGERVYMDNYWTEVNQTQSRDKALQAIMSVNITPQEREAAENGKHESDTLIDGEIWAMRMVSESIGIRETDMPPEVAQCRLSSADAALIAQEKQSAAIAYIFGPDYSMAKSSIRNNVNVFRNEITSRYADEALLVLSQARGTSVCMSVALMVLLAAMVITILCFLKLVVSPLIRFAGNLSRPDKGLSVTLRESGALEIKQFAKVFNALSAHVEQNTKRLEKMGYVDFLTGVPNRASITEYVSDQIRQQNSPLGLMMIDIDNFKKFNDTYGHALGDRVLRQVAQAICSVPPPGVGISGRLCGEEFVVSAPYSDETELGETAERILQSVRSISANDVGLPETVNFRITISVGGMLWRGEFPADFELLLSKADKALYVSKCDGKNKYSFYTGDGKAT